MKISEAKIFRYDLPLVKPMTTLDASKIRTGLILSLKNKHHIAYSEIAPLPGLHKESFDQALTRLETCLPHLLGQSLLENEPCSEVLLPSVAMGVDLALYQLWAKQKEMPLYRYLNATKQHVRLRALIDPLFEENVVSAAVSFVRQGYRTIKLKIGRLPYEKEVEMVKKVREAIGPDIEICLDANRAFDLSHAIELGRALARYRLIYIEEPLIDPRKSLEFYRETQIPVALDESWLENPLDALLDIKEAIFALIVKPSLLTGMKQLQEALSWMKIWGIRPIFTSTFESGLGLSLWVQLAALVDGDLAHGFGTFTWMKEDLLTPPFRSFRGQIDIVSMEKNLATFHVREGLHCRLLIGSTIG